METNEAARTFWRNCFTFILPALLLTLFTGCRTNQLLPAADFTTPGWHVQQGQAIWKPSMDRPELAGDLLLATNVNGNFFIQFSKIPFPVATAQVSGNEWQIEFGANKYSWYGHGTPPNRFAWFQLPNAFRDTNLGGNWRFTHVDTNSWQLKNSHTGETLEGEFFP
jgi:hypothetical protein